MTNEYNTVFYTGVTNNIIRRVWEHKNKINEGFTSRYNITKLVYTEEFNSMVEAIQREKRIKAGSRARKIQLIKSINPEYKELGFN
jgi:putative endonuclease